MTFLPQQLLCLSAVSLLAIGCGDLQEATMGDAGFGEEAGGDDADAADADAGDAGHGDDAGGAGRDGGDDGDAGDDGVMGYDDGGADAGDAGGDDGADDDGGEQCSSDDPCDCPDSAEALAGECDAACTTWTATAADANPVVALHDGGHAIHAPGFYCDGGTAIFGFDDVTLSLTDTGAELVGHAVVEDDGCGGFYDGGVWELDVELDVAPESMLPKLELANPEQTQSPAVTDAWLYYAFVEGHATMVNQQTGASATFSHRPADLTYGFQIGYTASGKNLRFGASGWFFFDHDGECGHRTGVGDFNVDLEKRCE